MTSPQRRAAATSARAAVALAGARVAVTRTGRALRDSVAERAASEDARSRALRLRASSRRHRRVFSIEGRIEEQPVLGVLRDDGLVVTASLLQRAQLLVSMGDEFEDDDGSSRPASLDGPPLSVLLTLIRACDQALAIELGPSTL